MPPINRPSRIGQARIARSVLLTAAAFLALIGSADAGTYYVRASGNDSNSGTSPAQAFRTFSKTNSVAGPGDTFYFGAGTYTAGTDLTKSGNSSSRLRYIADVSGSHTGDAGAVIVRPANGGAYALQLTYEHDVTLDGFTFQYNANAQYAWGVDVWYCDNVIISNCNFQNIYVGVLYEDSTCSQEDCSFAGCDYGMYNLYSEVTVDRANISAPTGGFGVYSVATSLYATDWHVTGG
ncbi:MAG: right-handed parallel beta-helix repeat-containing protein, partial [Planctomycetota bacterium]